MIFMHILIQIDYSKYFWYTYWASHNQWHVGPVGFSQQLTGQGWLVNKVKVGPTGHCPILDSSEFSLSLGLPVKIIHWPPSGAYVLGFRPSDEFVPNINFH